MSAPLTPEEKERYSSIIDAILATADLATVSRKKIRMGLETALGGKDLSDQKYAIKDLIESRFDAISNGPQSTSNEPLSLPPPSSAPEPTPKRKVNGHSYQDTTDVDDEVEFDAEAFIKEQVGDDDGDGKGNADADADDDHNGEITVSKPAHQPPKKKQKVEEDPDARLARELQEQENRLAMGRATRGGSANKITKKPRPKPRKKSDKRARDDSDGDGSEDSGSKRKAGGGFQKPFTLSYPLQVVTGETQLSRPQVVKKLWQYIKENQLQDPKDKRQIRCDDALHAVFKQNKVDMFQMNKLLGNQLYPIDED